jgi:hypothetical protein
MSFPLLVCFGEAAGDAGGNMIGEGGSISTRETPWLCMLHTMRRWHYWRVTPWLEEWPTNLLVHLHLQRDSLQLPLQFDDINEMETSKLRFHNQRIVPLCVEAFFDVFFLYTVCTYTFWQKVLKTFLFCPRVIWLKAKSIWLKGWKAESHLAESFSIFGWKAERLKVI